MKIAVISDIHVLCEQELQAAHEVHDGIGAEMSALKKKFHRGLHRVRRRFWNGHLERREPAFRHALTKLVDYDPDWVICNGDFGGDYGGVGFSNDHTFESARSAVQMMRDLFNARCRFVFGDHDLGKYSTALRGGGIRLTSLERGEQALGIPSFWHVVDEDFHLIGVNSSLFTLDLFLPEALHHEVPEWRRRRAEHIEHVSHAFDGLPPHARVILFCHDPGALSMLAQIPVVQQRIPQIERTIVGHLHAPSLLKLAKLAPSTKNWNPKYPVARIIARGLEGVHAWAQFNPVVCPSTFGTGHHLAGGLLVLEKRTDNHLVARKVRLPRPRHFKKAVRKKRGS